MKDQYDYPLTVRISAPMRNDLEDEAAARGYSSVSELVRHILREHQDKRKAALQ